MPSGDCDTRRGDIIQEETGGRRRGHGFRNERGERAVMGPRNFQKLTTATVAAHVVRTVRPRCLGAAPAGLGLSRDRGRRPGGHQRNLGAGETGAPGLIELLLVLAEVWVEVLLAGGPWIRPVAPPAEILVVVAVGVGVEERPGPTYDIGESAAPSYVFQRVLELLGGVRDIGGQCWCESAEATFLGIFVLLGTHDEPCLGLERGLPFRAGSGCLFRIERAVERSQTGYQGTNDW